MHLNITDEMVHALAAAKYLRPDRKFDWVAVMHAWQEWKADLAKGMQRIPRRDGEEGYEYETVESID